jgi:hypothetical protein
LRRVVNSICTSIGDVLLACEVYSYDMGRVLISLVLLVCCCSAPRSVEAADSGCCSEKEPQIESCCHLRALPPEAIEGELKAAPLLRPLFVPRAGAQEGHHKQALLTPCMTDSAAKDPVPIARLCYASVGSCAPPLFQV